MNANSVARKGGYVSVVCVKQVPDTKHVTGDAMTPEGTINRAALPTVFNPDDRNALEAALSVKEIYGGKVIAIAMGLPAAEAVLREALACGADEAYLVTDRKAAGSDTLATSYVLSQAVRKFAPDMVFCGRQAIDGDTAQTGPQIAEKLDFPAITYLEKVVEIREERSRSEVKVKNGGADSEERSRSEVKVKNGGADSEERSRSEVKVKNGGVDSEERSRSEVKVKNGGADSDDGESWATVVRDIGTGTETDRVKLPALFTVTEKFGELRPMDVRRLMKYKASEIPHLSCDDIGCEADRCGFAGSPTSVNKIESIVLAGHGFKQVEPTDEAIANLVKELKDEHTIG